MNDYLVHLIENPKVYYIYQNDLSIYGIESEFQKYLVIVDENYQLPTDFENYKSRRDWVKDFPYTVKFGGIEFEIFEMQNWFRKVLNCEIIAWQCSCLNKKFIIKEHVKLMLTTDLLKLRKNFDDMVDPTVLYANSELSKGSFFAGRVGLFNILKELIFSNQIIENHKIVNYKVMNEVWNKLNSCEDNQDSILGIFTELLIPEIKVFAKFTDGILRADKIKKFEQNANI